MKKLGLFALCLCAFLIPAPSIQAATASYTWSNPSNTHWMTLRYTTDSGDGDVWERLSPAATGNKLLTSYDGNTSNRDVAVFEVPLSSLRAVIPTSAVIDGANLVLTTAAADATMQGASAGIYHSGLNPSEEPDAQALYEALDDHQIVQEVEGPSFDPNQEYEIHIPTQNDGVASVIDDVLFDEGFDYYTIALLMPAFSGQTTNEIDATLGATLNIEYSLPVPVLSSLAVSTTSINIASAGGFFYATSTFDMAMATTTTPTITFSPNVVSSGTLTFSSGSWSTDGTKYAARYTIANVGEEQAGVDITVSGAVSSAGNGSVTMTASTSADRFSVDTIEDGGGGDDGEEESPADNGGGSSGGSSAARRAAIVNNQYVPSVVAPDPNIDPQVLASAPIIKALEEVIERLMFLISLLLSLHL